MTSGPPCRFLEWDSTHFGRRIAQVEGPHLSAERAREVSAWCEANRIECAYLLLDAGDAASHRRAEDAGFRLVDVRMTLERELQGPPDPSRDGVRRFKEGDLGRLCEIARGSHGGTRFYRDPGFDRSRSDALYETWIRKSCGGEADAVFVAAPAGAPSGYLTCHRVPEASGKIGLVAVAAEAQGSGWGRALIAEGLRWFLENSIRQVTVVTQGANLPALRLYESSGFLMKSLEMWFHRWFDIPGGKHP
jgi:ribosomal protein S18 acetylase RimI-like enzyme